MHRGTEVQGRQINFPVSKLHPSLLPQTSPPSPFQILVSPHSSPDPDLGQLCDEVSPSSDLGQLCDEISPSSVSIMAHVSQRPEDELTALTVRDYLDHTHTCKSGVTHVKSCLGIRTSGESF